MLKLIDLDTFVDDLIKSTREGLELNPSLEIGDAITKAYQNLNKGMLTVQSNKREELYLRKVFEDEIWDSCKQVVNTETTESGTYNIYWENPYLMDGKFMIVGNADKLSDEEKQDVIDFIDFTQQIENEYDDIYIKETNYFELGFKVIFGVQGYDDSETEMEFCFDPNEKLKLKNLLEENVDFDELVSDLHADLNESISI